MTVPQEARASTRSSRSSRGGARRRVARQTVDDFLAMQRCRCGEADPDVLEFHHLGAKRHKIARMISSGFSPRAILAELEGCEVLCVNCHRRLEARRRGHWRLHYYSTDPSEKGHLDD